MWVLMMIESNKTSIKYRLSINIENEPDNEIIDEDLTLELVNLILDKYKKHVDIYFLKNIDENGHNTTISDKFTTSLKKSGRYFLNNTFYNTFKGLMAGIYAIAIDDDFEVIHFNCELKTEENIEIKLFKLNELLNK